MIRAPYIFPNDIIDAIKADAVAWENYEKLSNPYKRIRIAYIDAARKRPNEFKKRLGNLPQGLIINYFKEYCCLRKNNTLEIVL